MEQVTERDKSTIDTEGDQCNETQRRSSAKSPIHASIPNSNQQSTSDQGDRRGKKHDHKQTSSKDNIASKFSKKSSTGEGTTNTESVSATQRNGSKSDCDTSPESGPTQSISMDSGNANDELSSSTKTERRSLRKGKWAVEEEEYTSRVIQHFSAGLLTLPDGATLRSYLAEKLNCDPMRITKKFTGACCLGRRVYHLRDRPRASAAELEMAKAERDHLEQRFRIRIEHEQSGLPLSRRLDMLVAQPPTNICTLFPAQNFAAGNTLSPWTQNFGPGRGPAFSVPQNGNQGIISLGQPKIPPNPLQHNQPRWLFPGISENLANPPGQPDPSLQLLSQLVTSWAVAQAAASLPAATLASLAASSMPAGAAPNSSLRVPHQPTPTLADLAQSQSHLDVQRQLRNAFEEQKKEEEQRQLRAAFEEQRRIEESKSTTAVATAAKKFDADTNDSTPNKLGDTRNTAMKIQDVSPAELLQKSYEAHLQALRKKEKKSPIKDTDTQKSPLSEQGHDDKRSVSTAVATKAHREETTFEDRESEQPMPDEEAGTVLLGFLNSLRQSYEDAMEKKNDDSKVDCPKSSIVTTEPTREAKNSTKDSPNLTSIIRNRQTETYKRGSKRSPERISPNNDPQDEPGRSLSTAVSRFISTKGSHRSQRPASVTDVSSGNSSSHQGEFSSSIEDSSDKTDPSSSEESEKEDPARKRWQSKGPPRKRVKSFTEENLIAHSKRMSENDDDGRSRG